MEHDKLDNFFRNKTGNLDDSLPENTLFDEQLFWGELQKKLEKPQPKNWWQWAAIAACLGGLVLWIVLAAKVSSEIPVMSTVKPVMPTKKEVVAEVVVKPEKVKPQPYKLKKKTTIGSDKNLLIPVEQLSFRVNTLPLAVPTIKTDTILFKPIVVAETKPQFRTIHANEISNTEKTPVPQPKFKIRFAARNQN